MRGERRSSVTCLEAGPELPALLDDPESVSRPVARHVAACLRCQAEVARYRRTRRLLRQLHHRHPSSLAPDPELDGGDHNAEAASASGAEAVSDPSAEPGPEAELEAEPAPSSSGRRLVLVGGIAAATLAAAATVTVVGRGWMVRAARAS